MNGRILIAILGIVLCTVAGSANAMRCSGKIVDRGDHQLRVAGLCGDPDYTEERTVLRFGIPRQYARHFGERHYSISREELLIHNRSLVEVRAEVWVFNRGPNRLMREIVFIDGRVVEVNRLGYGY
jgi:hypothetical protein